MEKKGEKGNKERVVRERSGIGRGRERVLGERRVRERNGISERGRRCGGSE